MSGRLVSIVFESGLPAWLKPYAAACASFANDDGTQVYPSVVRIARMVGRCERATQTAMQELRRRGVLLIVTAPGRHRATGYRFNAHALPYVDGPTQLPLFPQATGPKTRGARAEISTVSTGVNMQWTAPRGAVDCTRSVNDPSSTTHQFARARAKANARKTGT
jgi:hypothetical protein